MYFTNENLLITHYIDETDKCFQKAATHHIMHFVLTDNTLTIPNSKSHVLSDMMLKNRTIKIGKTKDELDLYEMSTCIDHVNNKIIAELKKATL
jgi:hypothetical protein